MILFVILLHEMVVNVKQGSFNGMMFTVGILVRIKYSSLLEVR